MDFDVVIANPPYQANTKSSGNTIWDKFVATSLDLLKDGGFLHFINPPRWRQPKTVFLTFTKTTSWYH